MPSPSPCRVGAHELICGLTHPDLSTLLPSRWLFVPCRNATLLPSIDNPAGPRGLMTLGGMSYASQTVALRHYVGRTFFDAVLTRARFLPDPVTVSTARCLGLCKPRLCFAQLGIRDNPEDNPISCVFVFRTATFICKSFQLTHFATQSSLQFNSAWQNVECCSCRRV